MPSLGLQFSFSLLLEHTHTLNCARLCSSTDYLISSCQKNVADFILGTSTYSACIAYHTGHLLRQSGRGACLDGIPGPTGAYQVVHDHPPPTLWHTSHPPHLTPLLPPCPPIPYHTPLPHNTHTHTYVHHASFPQVEKRAIGTQCLPALP